MKATPEELQKLQDAVNEANRGSDQAKIAAAKKALSDAKARQ
jgi:hypothetical protein